MKRAKYLLVPVILALLVLRPDTAGAITCPALSAYDKGVLVGEHIFGGAPSSGAILIRRGYVTEYDSERGVPCWAAWHATPEYLDTPKREGRWKSFRTDPDLDDPVRNGDYNGLKAAFDYARGHIVPYFIHKVGPDEDIHVPHMFYKILITESGIVAFLFTHKAQIGDQGCALTAALETCIVTVADIEALTGLDFFAGLPDADEALLEGTDGAAVWQVLLTQ